MTHLPPPLAFLDKVFRRVFDICFSLAGMIFLSPVFFLIYILIKRDSPGPAIYRGLRVGKQGRLFYIQKFRTMYEEEKSYQGAKVTAHDDARITPLGRWLRDTKLNELPQLWNVLKGEMSLVGPRPEDPEIVETWPEEVRAEVLSVRPGITSPASVVYRHEEDLLHSENVMGQYLWDILPTKLRLDQLYVRHRTILTDLDVIFWTSMVLPPRLKEYSVPVNWLVWGPFTRFINRYLSWFLVDMIISFGAIGVAGVIWRISAPLDLGVKLGIGIGLIIAFLFSLINASMGLNRISWSRASPGNAMDLAISSGTVTLVLFFINLFWGNEPLLPPSMLAVAGAISFTGFVAARYRSRLITGLAIRWMQLRGSKASAVGERVLIVGSGEVGQFAARLIRNGDLAQAFSIVGMVDDDPRKIGMQIAGCNVIGSTQDIPELSSTRDVGLILFAITKIAQEDQRQIISLCQSTSARLVMIPDVLDTLRSHFPSNEEERYRLFTKIIHNTTIDKITEVYNRYQFVDLAKREVSRAHRYGNPLSLIMLQADFQGHENVNYSTVIEDQVMRFVAKSCCENIRSLDIPGRYGENELAFMLPETSLPNAQKVARRIKSRIENKTVQTESGPVGVRLKIGVSGVGDDKLDIDSMIESAYFAMEAH
jgi:diguanylate cyclase (GGDEF)-like protein